MTPNLDQARDTLQRVFGYPNFRHNQAPVIDTLLQGGDALVLMPTGGGKSLCYQIPALLRPGCGIVVSPLIALMQDQVDALRQLGIRGAFLNSSLSPDQQQQTEQALLSGDLDLLYVAPERLLLERSLKLLECCPIALFAIDEAHCVSQWGHDFRKEYQRLSILHQRFPRVPRIALTATADQRTRDEIISQLSLASAKTFLNSFDRPNIRYTIAEGQNHKQQLWRFLQQEHPRDAGIVYCLSRKRTEEIAAWLCSQGRTALPYHAGLSASQRQEHQERFLREEGLIICATIAFGMGIDKPDVRFVAHLNLPKSIESYYQETGRAGRDGQPANAWMAYGLQDVISLREMLLSSDAEEQFKRIAQQKLDAMLGLCELSSCRRQSLLSYFGEALPKPCGNCDNCLQPPETWDAQVAAQKALSCVFRTGQRFGVSYLIDVLLGKADDRIRRNGHHEVSTFGIGQELSNGEWRTLYRQLLARGYLQLDSGGHGTLQLSDSCGPLLRGEEALTLRKITKLSGKDKTNRADRKTREDLQAWDQDLFEALRSLRLTLAREQGVPPYVIFHDSTLQSMARQRPSNRVQFQFLPGVGERKLERYGDDFLAVIAQHPLPSGVDERLSDTVNQSLYLLSQGLEIEQVAEQRALKANTIYGHCAAAIELGLLEAKSVLPLDEAAYAEILNAMELLDCCEDPRTGPLFEALEGRYDHGILRCVLAEACDCK